MNCASGGSEDVQRVRQRFTCFWEGFSFKSRGEMFLYQLGPPLKLPPWNLMVFLSLYSFTLFAIRRNKPSQSISLLSSFTTWRPVNASVCLSSSAATSRCQGLTSRRYCCSSWLQYTCNQCGICTSRQTEVTLVSPSCCISHSFLVNSLSLSVSQSGRQAVSLSLRHPIFPSFCLLPTRADNVHCVFGVEM